MSYNFHHYNNIETADTGVEVNILKNAITIMMAGWMVGWREGGMVGGWIEGRMMNGWMDEFGGREGLMDGWRMD